MSDLSKHQNHQSDGADPNLMDSRQPNSVNTGAIHTKKDNDKLIPENEGPQDRIDNAEARISDDETQMIIEHEFKTQATKNYSNDVMRSRQIHRKLQIQKSRWKPNESELRFLKSSFEANQYPSREEKEKLLKILEQNLNTKIDLAQLGRWFQHQRERYSKLEGKDVRKNTYKKFTKKELEYLKDCFTKNTYPKLEEMTEVAKKLKSSISKIENWYKHNRRSLAKRGLFKLKNKKYFKKEEFEYLQQNFALFPRPSKQKYTEMYGFLNFLKSSDSRAKNLNCDESHIKNWYSNRRKKIKQNAKKSHSIQNTISDVNETSNSQIRDSSHFDKSNQQNAPIQNPLIMNLPMTYYKPVGGPNRNQNEAQQPNTLVNGINPGMSNPAAIKTLTIDANGVKETSSSLPNRAYYINSNPQFIPTSTNVPNNLYPNLQPQFVPVNYNLQPVIAPYYIQPQGFSQSGMPVLYHIGPPGQTQGPQVDNWINNAQSANQDSHKIKKEFQIQNIQSVVMNNQNNYSGTSTGSTSGTSAKNASSNTNKDASSSNASKQDQDSKDNASNSSSNLSKGEDVGRNDQDNFSNESAQDEVRQDEKQTKLKKFHSSDIIQEERNQTIRTDKGINRKAVFREEKDQEASLPNQGRNLDLSKEYKKDQGNALLTADLHSGSKMTENKLPINTTTHMPGPWMGPQGMMLAPNFSSYPSMQPIANSPVQFIAPNNVEFANPSGQMPYVVGFVYPYQNITANYYPTFQTNSFIYSNLPKTTTTNNIQSEASNLQSKPIQQLLTDGSRSNPNPESIISSQESNNRGLGIKLKIEHYKGPDEQKEDEN